MKGIIALIVLILSAAEGKYFSRDIYNGQWRRPLPPPGHQHGHPHGHPHGPPGPPFQPPPNNEGYFCPPGHSCPPPAQPFPLPGPPNQVPGLGVGRPEFQGWNPFQQHNMVDVSKAEWVCQNPKTGDTMIITAVDGQPSQTEAWPNTSEVPNTNGNPNNVNPHNGNPNNVNPHNGNPNNVNPHNENPNNVNSHNGNPNNVNPHNGNPNNVNPHNGNPNNVNPNNEYNNNIKPTSETNVGEPQTHGGEGLIDIRLGAKR